MSYNFPAKQDVLVSGTNIKTINSNSLLGSGNLTISGLPSSVNPTDADKVVAVNSSGVASWQYAGLGAGSLGTNNVILGQGLPSGMTSTDTVLVGVNAGKINATGNRNTILGSGSGSGLTSGANNFFGGYNSASTTTTGSRNVVIGDTARVGIATANNHVVIGYNAIGGNDLQFAGSVIIGANATALGGYGNDNVCIGGSSLISSGGRGSVAIGHGATISGDGSVAIGAGASTAGWSTVIGASNSNFSFGGRTTNQNVFIGGYDSNSGGLVAKDFYLGAPGSGFTYITQIGPQQGYPVTLQPTPLGQIPTGNASAAAGTFTISGCRGVGSGTGGDLIFSTSPAGAANVGLSSTLNPLIERLRVKAETEIVVNDTGVDFDFRVEGDTDANLLFVDASTDKVGIGTASPATKLHAQQTSAATSTVTNILRVDSQSSGTPANGIGVGIEMAAETSSGNTEVGVVLEAVTTDVTSTSEDFDFVVKTMAAGGTAAERMKVASTGTVTVANGDMVLNTEGNGLKIKTGADATAGLATISNGNSSVTVNTNKCSATSIILVTNQTSTAYVAVTTKTSGSFKIEHANAVGADQECAWFIINPA